VDAIFGEIVADLRAEGVGARLDTDQRSEGASADEQDDWRDTDFDNRADRDAGDDWLDDDLDDRDDRADWDTDTDRRRGSAGDTGDSRATGDRPGPAASGWRASEVGWDDTMLSNSDASMDDDDEHFVPPEPPPLPKPSRSMGIVALFVVVGLVLLIAPHLIGIGVTVATPLGMLSLAAGLGFLLLHARDDNRPPGSDPDNGAQV
ncbi:MAG: hypothetical protein GEV04_10080, partial [Actinophytocola sp.]|nr:hypothetical protein [Actinophytocola sp.]